MASFELIAGLIEGLDTDVRHFGAYVVCRCFHTFASVVEISIVRSCLCSTRRSRRSRSPPHRCGAVPVVEFTVTSDDTIEQTPHLDVRQAAFGVCGDLVRRNIRQSSTFFD